MESEKTPMGKILHKVPLLGIEKNLDKILEEYNKSKSLQDVFYYYYEHKCRTNEIRELFEFINAKLGIGNERQNFRENFYNQLGNALSLAFGLYNQPEEERPLLEFTVRQIIDVCHNLLNPNNKLDLLNIIEIQRSMDALLVCPISDVRAVYLFLKQLDFISQNRNLYMTNDYYRYLMRVSYIYTRNEIITNKVQSIIDRSWPGRISTQELISQAYVFYTFRPSSCGVCHVDADKSLGMIWHYVHMMSDDHQIALCARLGQVFIVNMRKLHKGKFCSICNKEIVHFHLHISSHQHKCKVKYWYCFICNMQLPDRPNAYIHHIRTDEGHVCRLLSIYESIFDNEDQREEFSAIVKDCRPFSNEYLKAVDVNIKYNCLQQKTDLEQKAILPCRNMEVILKIKEFIDKFFTLECMCCQNRMLRLLVCKTLLITDQIHMIRDHFYDLYPNNVLESEW